MGAANGKTQMGIVALGHEQFLFLQIQPATQPHFAPQPDFDLVAEWQTKTPGQFAFRGAALLLPAVVTALRRGCIEWKLGLVHGWAGVACFRMNSTMGVGLLSPCGW